MTNIVTQLFRVPRSKRSMVLLALGLTAIIALAAFRRAGLLGGKRGGGGDAAAAGANTMPPMPVDVDTARRGSVVDAVRATGRIEAIQAVDLRPDERSEERRVGKECRYRGS